MEAKTEQVYDELEMMSYQALMMRAAYHGKKKNMKPSDLFKRPKQGQTPDVQDMKAQIRQQQDWLSQFDFGKEGANGD